MTEQPRDEAPTTPETPPQPESKPRPALGASVAAILGLLFVLAAIGIGLASGRIARPSPTPVRVSVTFTPAPTPSPTPYNEAAVFRGQPLSGGCATSGGVWLVTNGGGLLRYDGTQWAQVDSTLRSLTRVACGTDAVYGIGFLGAVLVADEQSRQIRSTDVTVEDLWGVAALPNGALMVGTAGSVFVLDSGDIQPYAKGIDENLFGVVAFSLQSAWAVGDRGITYRLDQRGWNPVGSGQTNTLRAVAATTPVNAIAVGDAGTIVTYASGWQVAKSGVDVTLRDVIVDPGVWIVGDRGTVLTTSGVPATPFKRVDIGTTCDLIAVFGRAGDVWVVGRGELGGGVWRLRNGAVAEHFGGC
jgi:hypothetical protein